MGTESAAFIEPIAQRKDGIEATFANQKKRKRDSSEAAILHASTSQKAEPASPEVIEILSDDDNSEPKPAKKVSHLAKLKCR